MKRISVVVGTRPEAVKMAPLILALRDRADADLSVCFTGQHADMVDPVFNIFSITPDERFSTTKKPSSLNELSAKLLTEFERYYTTYQPDVVMVQGDTLSVLTAALAAYKLRIPIAHVEAGLRTDNLYSPWPEEGIRRMVSQITKYHFAPTEESAQNIKQSGVPTDSIIQVTGNTVIDALLHVNDLIEKKAVAISLPPEIKDIANEKMVLITGHRRENFGGGLDNLCSAISSLAAEYQDVRFVFPVHLNPVVQEQVRRSLDPAKYQNVILTSPQPYVEFVWLMKQSHFIITDSGGIQEEAPGLGKPVLVTRDTTERPEGIKAGTVRLVGTDKDAIFAEAKKLLEDRVHYQSMAQAKNPYGDGKAAARIIKTLLD